jgi:hypothetical protein
MRNRKQVSRWRRLALLAVLIPFTGCHGGEDEVPRRFMAILGDNPIIEVIYRSTGGTIPGTDGVVASDDHFFYSPDFIQLETIIVAPQWNRFEVKGNLPAIPCEPPRLPMQQYAVELRDASRLPDHVKAAFPPETVRIKEIVLTSRAFEDEGAVAIQHAAWHPVAPGAGLPVTLQTAALAQGSETVAACTDVGFSVREIQRELVVNFGSHPASAGCTNDSQCGRGYECTAGKCTECQNLMCQVRPNP